MKLDVFRPLWGVVRAADGFCSMEEACRSIAKLGYKGIECPMVVALDYGKDRFNALLQKHGLSYIGMVFTDGPVCPYEGGHTAHPKPGPSPKEHLEVFKAQVREAQELNPVFINSHSGNDYFTVAQAEEFFSGALEFQEQEGFEVFHETHRKRYLHSPWVTRDFIHKFPQMKLVADLSHWICVAETDTNDKALNDVISMIAPQVHHIHARVGYDHGPQVADPRTPEWLPYTEGHEQWWDTIWEAQAARGQAVTTVSPEHGPPNYQQTVPGTRQPLASIWEVNHFIAQRQADRFQAKHGQGSASQLQPLETVDWDAVD